MDGRATGAIAHGAVAVFIATALFRALRTGRVTVGRGLTTRWVAERSARPASYWVSVAGIAAVLAMCLMFIVFDVLPAKADESLPAVLK